MSSRWELYLSQSSGMCGGGSAKNCYLSAFAYYCGGQETRSAQRDREYLLQAQKSEEGLRHTMAAERHQHSMPEDVRRAQWKVEWECVLVERWKGESLQCVVKRQRYLDKSTPEWSGRKIPRNSA